MSEDREITAMRAIAAALGPLTPPERRRTLKWAWARYCPPLLLAPAETNSLDAWSGEAAEHDDTGVGT